MAQNDNNMGVLVALVGIGVAAVALFTGSASASRPTSREQVMRNLQPSLVEQLQDAVTSSSDSTSSSGSSGGDVAEYVEQRQDAVTSSSDSTSSSGSSGGDVAEYVERTGLLPSGNDVASRIATINDEDFQEDYESGQGFVGL